MATRFKVTATVDGVDQSSAEVLGEAFGRTFGLRKVAEIVRDQLVTDAAENGVDGVTYMVEEVTSSTKATHVHAFGPIEISRFAGNPHRRCACGVVSLDLGDEEEGGAS